MSEANPQPHKKLAVFLGDWHAEGTSYGGDEQSSANPHAGATPWRSIHSARWHSGDYFIVQDERANGPFDTLSLMGWDAEAGRYFAWSIENHGFARDYTLTRIPKQRIGTCLGVQANWKRRGRSPHQGIGRSGSWAVRMIGL